MYVNSLEASFVDELHNSNRLGGWGVKNSSCKPYSSDQVWQPKFSSHSCFVYVCEREREMQLISAYLIGFWCFFFILQNAYYIYME